MPLYEVSCRTTLVTASVAAALCALRGSTTRPTRVHEISIFSFAIATTSSALGLCRSTALGTGALTSVTPVARQPSFAAPGAVLVTAWATLAPTNGGVAAVFKRWNQPLSVGNGIIWDFRDEPLELALGGAATGELCIVNIPGTAPGTFDISMIIEE